MGRCRPYHLPHHYHRLGRLYQLGRHHLYLQEQDLQQVGQYRWLILAHRTAHHHRHQYLHCYLLRHHQYLYIRLDHLGRDPHNQRNRPRHYQVHHQLM